MIDYLVPKEGAHHRPLMFKVGGFAGALVHALNNGARRGEAAEAAGVDAFELAAARRSVLHRDGAAHEVHDGAAAALHDGAPEQAGHHDQAGLGAGLRDGSAERVSGRADVVVARQPHVGIAGHKLASGQAACLADDGGAGVDVQLNFFEGHQPSNGERGRDTGVVVALGVEAARLPHQLLGGLHVAEPLARGIEHCGDKQFGHGGGV